MASLDPAWAAVIPSIVEKTDEYMKQTEEGVSESWQLVNSEGWRLEKRGSVKNDVVESINSKKHGKVYRFTGSVECSARWFYEDLRDKYETLPQWNPTVLECKTIKELGNNTAVVYQAAAGGGGGIVAPRDFVMLRRLCAVDNGGRILSDDDPDPAAYLVTGFSVQVPGFPPVKNYVRGETKIGNWIMRPHVETIDGKTVETCIFQWLFNCDLKGRMPGFVVDAAMATVMLENVGYIRKHAALAKQPQS